MICVCWSACINAFVFCFLCRLFIHWVLFCACWAQIITIYRGFTFFFRFTSFELQLMLLEFPQHIGSHSFYFFQIYLSLLGTFLSFLSILWNTDTLRGSLVTATTTDDCYGLRNKRFGNACVFVKCLIFRFCFCFSFLFLCSFKYNFVMLNFGVTFNLSSLIKWTFNGNIKKLFIQS